MAQNWTKVLSKDGKYGGIVSYSIRIIRNRLRGSLASATAAVVFSSGGPGSGLYRSEDNGVTWKHLEGNGLPEGILGKIGIAVSGADANRIYAMIEAKEGGLYRSDDAGQKWTRVMMTAASVSAPGTSAKLTPTRIAERFIFEHGDSNVDAPKTFNLLPRGRRSSRLVDRSAKSQSIGKRE